MAKKPADDEAPTETITKTEAVKAALAEGMESPEEGVAFIKSKYGLDITKPQFSTYKSLSKKKNGGSMRAKSQPMASAPAAAPTPARSASGDVAVGVETIKSLVDKLGVDQVVRIAQLFGK